MKVLKNPIGWLIGLIFLALGWMGFEFLFSQSHCVLEGTLVDTPEGAKPIEVIREGDWVTTQSATGDVQIGRVRGVERSTSRAWLEFEVDGGQLRVTREHPLSTPRGWTAAGQLRVGDLVNMRKGPRPIAGIIAREGSARAFDLEVDPNSNYFADGVLVHNKSLPWRNAAATLKSLASAQADFRGNDRDKNGKLDFWVADVAGLYRLRVDHEEIRLIESSLANADDRPQPTRAGVEYGASDPFQTKAGYAFRALLGYEDESGATQPYNQGEGRNPWHYGFIAIPAPYSKRNRFTLLMTESGVVFRKDLKGEAVETAPRDPSLSGWETEP